MFPEKVMKDQYGECSDEELTQVLVTLDGRGPKNKQIALDILLRRAYDRGHDDLKRAMEGQP